MISKPREMHRVNEALISVCCVRSTHDGVMVLALYLIPCHKAVLFPEVRDLCPLSVKETFRAHVNPQPLLKLFCRRKDQLARMMWENHTILCWDMLLDELLKQRNKENNNKSQFRKKKRRNRKEEKINVFFSDGPIYSTIPPLTKKTCCRTLSFA